MKKTINLWQLSGFAITSLSGTLLHFIYEWLNESVWVAPFSGVNESTWEHMKLLFFPLFIFALIQSRQFKMHKSFWCIKLIGIITGLLLIPVLFYTYNGAFGKSPDWVNIAIFFVSAAAVFLIETRLFRKDTISCRHPLIPISIMIIIGILFAVFTILPPEIPLFMDPLTGTYGI